MQTMRDILGIGSNSNGTQIQSASIGNITPAKVQTEQINDSALSDFSKGAEGLQNAAKAMHTGAIDRQKLVASDYAANYAAGVSTIEKFYADKEARGEALTSKDIQEKMKWKEDFHKKMIGDGVDASNRDGDLDEKIVKDGFIEPAIRSFNSGRKTDSEQYIRHIQKEFIPKMKNQYAAFKGDIPDNTIFADIEQAKKIGIPFPEDLIYGLVTNNFNAAFDEKFKDGFSSASAQQYIKNGVINEKGKDALFNSIYKNVVVRKDGVYSKVKGHENLPDDKYQSIIKGFKGWVDRSGKQVSLSHLEFDKTYSDIQESIKNGSTMNSEGDKAKIAKLTKQYDYYYNSPIPTQLQKDALSLKLYEMNRDITQNTLAAKFVDEKVVLGVESGSVSDVKEAMETGAIIEGQPVSKEKVTKQVTKKSVSISRQIDTINVIDKKSEDENTKLFYKYITTGKNLSILTGKAPEAFNRYNSLYHNSSITFSDSNEAMKALLYSNHDIATSDGSSDYYKMQNVKLRATLEREYKDENGIKLKGSDLEKAKMNAFTEQRNTIINDKFGQPLYKQSIGIIVEEVDKYATGEDAWFTVLDSDVHQNTYNTVYKLALNAGVLNGGKQALRDFVRGLNVVHVGNWFPAMVSTKDKSVILPQGADESRYKGAISDILEENKLGYGNSDIYSSFEEGYIDVDGVARSGLVVYVTNKDGYVVGRVYPSTAVAWKSKNSTTKGGQNRGNRKSFQK